MNVIGERIKELREEAVYGQAELARAAGISAACLWLIENGKRDPRPATIRKIARALGVQPTSLLSDWEHR